MIRKLLHPIYTLPIQYVIAGIIIMPIIWGILAGICSNRVRYRGWQAFNRVLVVLFFAGVLTTTLISRNTGGRTVEWVYFEKVKAAAQNPELYREMLMNILLFVPLGLMMPFAFTGTYKNSFRNIKNRKDCNGSVFKSVLYTVLFGFIISVMIECLQFILSKGVAEPEDVICNTLGTIWGLGAILIWCVWNLTDSTQRK